MLGLSRLISTVLLSLLKHGGKRDSFPKLPRRVLQEFCLRLSSQSER